MTNILTKIFKNIFLLVMSILKTLGSNYIPLLLVSLIVFNLLHFISQRKLTLKCNACDNGSWYYKCKVRTGFGTRTCRHYKLVTETTYDIINLVNKGSEKLIKSILMLIQHTTRVLKKFILLIDNLKIILFAMFPQRLIYIYLVIPITKAVFKSIKAATESLNLFSCSFTIPIINEKIDICNLIIEGILFLFDAIILVFNTIISIIGLIGKLLYSFFKKYIIDELVKLISKTMKFISKNIMYLLIESIQVVNKVTKPLNVILDIPIYQYSLLILNSIFNFIINTLPGGELLINVQSLILGYIIIYLIILIVLPTIGGFIALFPLIKSILYFMLGLDDDSDFKFLFDFIFKFINRIKLQFIKE